MITVKFYGYSDVEEYIENTKVDVVDSFQMYYPDSECETKIIKEEEQFEFVFSGEWSSPEDIDEDVVKEICNSHELYCSIHQDNKSNKSYYYDEDDVFVYD
ncbi:hypothetical protein N9M11_05025 [Flavobacteriaceae bacterium]|uniref:hypothetical protein n=1 Tax=Candidatus Arcticimaribacter forsetii TaxID=2820661 RepID=UPI002076DD34|nr:hypothetical protein [Candidatus Arcticimaribacter forsetii]MDA8699455.1 hypothetical protein [Flavobacteriaceae bacterium]MDB2326199.1 hypothetical protein [Flavobacteriaceae bacterium]MDB2346162.1 hypothetical protein [Flavobacteriaceae bacterium]MDB4675138.1 hypothetical protein [Flavobacteriaceae bacterium]